MIFVDGELVMTPDGMAQREKNQSSTGAVGRPITVATFGSISWLSPRLDQED